MEVSPGGKPVHTKLGKTFNTVAPYVPPSNSTSPANLDHLFKWNDVPKDDALQAVKLDPAVLEAQVTLETSQGRPDPPESQAQQTTSSAEVPSFAEMLGRQQAALLSLSEEQLGLLMQYADTLRAQREMNQQNMECAFCKNNGESVSWYTSHALRSWRGRVLCPVLRAFRCPRCGATGDRAHTIKYCPDNNGDRDDMWSPISWS